MTVPFRGSAALVVFDVVGEARAVRCGESWVADIAGPVRTRRRSVARFRGPAVLVVLDVVGEARRAWVAR